MATRIEMEEQPIAIPVGALTPDGCRVWSATDDRPDGVRASYIGKEIVIDSESEGELVRMPVSAATLDGFRAWATADEFPERGRISFIDQEIVIDMSPEELQTHIKVKSKIGGVIENLVERLDIGDFYGDGTLVSNSAAGLSTEPDGTVVLWTSLQSETVRLVPRKDRPGQFMEIEGTPDWVLEVVSLSSVRKDTVKLLKAYFEAGIPEYWIVNAMHDELDFQILLRETGGYVAGPVKHGWNQSRLFDRWFRLERSQNKMGFWRYNLRVKSKRKAV